MFENLFAVGGLSLDRLKNFVEVAEKGTIARVAHGDPSKQSLISRQISELEAFFGTELTRRKGKGLELTEAGLELARQTRLQFQGLADFRSSCRSLPVEYRIASGNSNLEWLVVPEMLTAAAPEATFSFLDWRTRDVARGLLDHTVDFGIMRRSAVIQPLKFKPLGKISYALFLPLAWKGKKQIPNPLPLAISIGGEFLQMFEKATAKSGQVPHIVHRCTSFTQAAQLVRSSVAAAILPRIAATSLAGQANIQTLPWIKEIVRDLVLAWHQRSLEVRPGSKELLAVMEGALRERIARES